MTQVDSPSKKSAVERLNQQNAQLRQQLTLIQNQKFQLQKLSKQQQGQLKVYEMKYNAVQNQLQKQKTQNHRFIEAYQKEKKERLVLVNDQQSVLNNLNRDEVELSKLSNQNKVLTEQVQTLEKSLDIQKNERVAALRQRQNNNNKIKLLETKLEATTMEARFSQVSKQELEGQNKRLKDTLIELQQQLQAREGPLQVQTIIKESSSSTQQLLKNFEQKMKEKEKQFISEIQKSENRNSALTLKIAELQTKLLTNKH